MKILATIDGSQFSEAILPQLEMLAAVPGAEFTILSIAPTPHTTQRPRSVPAPVVAGIAAPGGVPMEADAQDVEYVEDLGEAVERVLAEREDYLRAFVARLPEGARCDIDVTLDDHPASAIIRYAMQHRPDMIVMGTHGTTGMIHRLFGDVAEQVVSSGVAPVLLVHPNAAHR